ncbi:MAG: tetratricopeptide repeat protein [Saprospiraceae bacterium]
MSKSKKNRFKKQPVAAKPPKPAAPRTWFRKPAGLAALLAGVCILLYANTFGHGFVLDDALAVSQNALVQRGFSGIGDIFAHDFFYGFFQDESKAALVSGGRYRPLTLAMFAVEYQLSGGSATALHIFNVLWYALTTVVLFFFLRRLFLQPGRKERVVPAALLTAGVTALLFAVHPLHTEVVANIKGRDEIIALLGGLLAAHAALRYADGGGKKWLGGVAAALFAGLLAKENAVAFIGVSAVSFYIFRPERTRAAVVTTAVGLGALAVYLFVRATVLGWSFGEPSAELLNNPFLKLVGNTYVPFSGGERLATITYTLGEYLRLLAVPAPLTHDYYPRAVAVMQWGDWRVLLAFFANLALLGFGLWAAARRRLIGFGILVYFGTLFLVSNLVFPVGTNMSERFAFMPSAGYAVVVAALWSGYRLKRKPGTSKWLVWGPLAALVVIYSIITVARNPAWESNYTLFTTDISTSPNSAKLRNAMGGVLVDTYQKLPAAQQPVRREMLQEAIGHLNEALVIHPLYKEPLLIRGNAKLLLDDYDGALLDYDQALQLNPDYEAATRNKRIGLQMAGKYYGEQQGDVQRAIGYLTRAYQMDQTDPETTRLLGIAYAQAGRIEEAIPYMEKAAEANPGVAVNWQNLAAAYAQAGRAEDSRRAAARARGGKD